MKKLFCALLIMVSISGVACSDKNVASKAEYSGERVSVLAEENDLKQEFETKEFNLGKKTYTSTSGKQMSYEDRGIISYPKSEGKKPLAIFIHGSHDNENEGVRFDTGFKYATEKLAQNDYVGISLDVQNAYVWKFGDNDDNEKIRFMLKSFIDSLKGDEELASKIDFDNIVLIGHSRGGETVLDAANEVEGVKGVLSLAPTFSNDKKYADVKTLIVVPEFDGDVADLDGIKIYEDILEDKEKESDTDLIMLEKANHNYFNTNLEKNDTEMSGDKQKLANQLSKEEQQLFLQNISIDFMSFVFKDETKEIFDKSKVEVSKIYGLDVKVRGNRKDLEYILSNKNYNLAKSEDAELSVLVEDPFFKKDETKGFSLPMANTEEGELRKLLSVEWKNKDTKVSFDLGGKDLSKNKVLDFNMAIDPSNELNKPNENQSFSIVLKDGKGNTSKVVINNDAKALSYVEGKLDFTELETEKIYFWTSFTPLCSMRVPLELFKDIDLNSVTEMQILFDKTESGAFMLENVTTF